MAHVGYLAVFARKGSLRRPRLNHLQHQHSHCRQRPKRMVGLSHLFPAPFPYGRGSVPPHISSSLAHLSNASLAAWVAQPYFLKETSRIDDSDVIGPP